MFARKPTATGAAQKPFANECLSLQDATSTGRVPPRKPLSPWEEGEINSACLSFVSSYLCCSISVLIGVHPRLKSHGIVEFSRKSDSENRKSVAFLSSLRRAVVELLRAFPEKKIVSIPRRSEPSGISQALVKDRQPESRAVKPGQAILGKQRLFTFMSISSTPILGDSIQVPGKFCRFILGRRWISDSMPCKKKISAMKCISTWRSLNAVIPGVAMVLLPALYAGGASLPYLPTIGPSPLRFEYVAPPDASFLEKLVLPKPRFIPDPPMPGCLPPTNEDDTIISSSTSSPVILPAKTGPPFLGGMPGNSAGSKNSASDLLNLTPAMINNYFKPRRRDGDGSDSGAFQQGDSIYVPAEMGFVPPGSPESRAVYRSK
jgi:hypothetical protein